MRMNPTTHDHAAHLRLGVAPGGSSCPSPPPARRLVRARLARARQAAPGVLDLQQVCSPGGAATVAGTRPRVSFELSSG